MKLLSFFILVGFMYLSYRLVSFLFGLSSVTQPPMKKGINLCLAYVHSLNTCLPSTLNSPTGPNLSKLKHVYEEGERFLWGYRNGTIRAPDEYYQTVLSLQALVAKSIALEESRQPFLQTIAHKG